MESLGLLVGHLVGDYLVQNDWMAANKTTRTWPCLVHCFLYTLAVFGASFWWMSAWGLAACFLVHFPIDRWRLARWSMVRVTGQEQFATGPLSPWSIIVVDNTYHLLTLFLIGLACGR